MFCLIASPLTWIFYRGLNLISTYRDSRFRTTMKESLDTINAGQNVIVFPEDSSTGYHDKLEGLMGGFVVFGKYCLKHGIDLPIHVAYYRKHDKKYIIDKSVKSSELLAKNMSQEEIMQAFCHRINQLSEMQFDDNVVVDEVEEEVVQGK